MGAGATMKAIEEKGISWSKAAAIGSLALTVCFAGVRVSAQDQPGPQGNDQPGYGAPAPGTQVYPQQGDQRGYGPGGPDQQGNNQPGYGAPPPPGPQGYPQQGGQPGYGPGGPGSQGNNQPGYGP